MSSGQDRPAPLRVLVVDGDDRVRASLIGLLAIGDRLEVIGDAGTSAAALDLAARTHPDAIVIDPRLPDLDQGRACIRRLRATVPGIRIIALTCPDSTGDDGLDGLVDAAVRKTFRPGQLQEAVLAAGAPVAH